MQLSAQADLKANIVLTLSVLVLSIALARIGSGAHRWTLVVFAIGDVIALLFAIGAVLPNLRLRRHRPEEQHELDTLYFADFAKLDYEDWERRIGRALRDDAEIYRLLMRNIHNQGRYLLGQKYRYIRLAYLWFVGAIVAAGIAELVRLA